MTQTISPALDGSRRPFFVIAGEPSGDTLGASLIQGLRERDPTSTFVGIGGEKMERVGEFQSLIPLSKLSHMGLTEVLCHLPSLVSSYRTIKRSVHEVHPRALITIDAPDLTLRLAHALKAEAFPRIHCVAPSVWAWRPGRAKKIAPFLDHLLTFFPFEPDYFTPHGLKSTFVGHPLAQRELGSADRFFKHYSQVKPEKPLLTVLPGSRETELNRLLLLFVQTAYFARTLIPELQVVFLTLPHLLPLIEKHLRDFDYPLILISDSSHHADAMRATTAALAASGTVTLELGLQETPMVVGYKTSWLTAQIARRMLTTPFVSLVNILHGRAVVPEHLQESCDLTNLLGSLLPLLRKGDQWKSQKKTLSTIRETLRTADNFEKKAAQVILDLAPPPL